MSEIEKMTDRLLLGPTLPDGTRNPNYKLLHFNVWWGPEEQTPEQRAAAVNRVLAQYDAGELVDCLPDGGIEQSVYKPPMRTR